MRAKRGARKTKIVYGANLNFKILGEYLEKLEKTGLVMGEPKNIIRTMEKGLKFLEGFKGLIDMLI